MNNYELAKKINELDGLTNEEKSELLKLLRSQKKYGLVWEDKPEDAELRMADKMPVLEEVTERAIISDDTEAPNHILIEGDNLEALTALSYTHNGKIDIIYIDPPYNTRKKDFKYNDTFLDPDDAFSHSTWLSFMSKRLKLAKGLLAPNGLIYIQIDDREYAALKLLCDEIFQESNSLGPFIQNKLNAKNDTLNIQKNHEYILCYRKKALYQDEAQTKIAPNILIKYHRNKPVLEENGSFFYLKDSITTRGEGGTLNARPNLGYTFYFNPRSRDLIPCVDYDIEKAKTSNNEQEIYSTLDNYISLGYVPIRPPKVRGKLGCWTWDISKAKKDLDSLYIKQSKSRYNVHKRIFVPKEKIKQLGNSYMYEEELYSNSKSILEYSTNEGTDTLVEVMGYEAGFNNPKNVRMIDYLLSIVPNPNSLILDFFAGSGTTLHATMQLNAEDGGHRQCILATNNENHICENVTYERNRRVIQGYTTPKGEDVAGLTHNNLRYYKTKLLTRKQTVKNKRALVSASTDLLCIKNDVYTEQTHFAGRKLKPACARYFDNGKTKMLVIYNELTVNAFAETIYHMDTDGKILIYVFSNTRYAYDDDFEEVLDKVELCTLPAAIYDAYRNILPEKKPTFEEPLEAEENVEAKNEKAHHSNVANEGQLSFDFQNE